jgi:hypothetical protein
VVRFFSERIQGIKTTIKARSTAANVVVQVNAFPFVLTGMC